MGSLIDSSIFIAAERQQLDLSKVLDKYANEPIAMAAITASELLHGIHRAGRTGVRARREAFVEHLLSRIPVISFDLVVARVHARLWAELAAKGMVAGAHDLLIASTALAMGYDVASHDRRSFPKIPGLGLKVW